MRNPLDRLSAAPAAAISVAVLCLFGFSTYATLFEVVPATNKELANIMLGCISTLAVTVVNYWVGSSRGSAAKDERIERLAGASPAVRAPAAAQNQP